MIGYGFTAHPNHAAERVFWLRLCSDQIAHATERLLPPDALVASRPDGVLPPSCPADDFTAVLEEISR